MDETHRYYYLHTDGSLIHKPASVVQYDPDYFDSPFVAKVWRINTGERLDAWRMLVEALALGADPNRVLELTKLWTCDLADLAQYVLHEDNVTGRRADGLRMILSLWGYEKAEFFAAVAATPNGKDPDVSKLRSSKTVP